MRLLRARGKSEKELTSVVFPAVTSAEVPSWLWWSRSEWLLVREEWFEQVGSIPNIEAYLRNCFLADMRVAAAQIACASDAEAMRGLPGIASSMPARDVRCPSSLCELLASARRTVE